MTNGDESLKEGEERRKSENFSFWNICSKDKIYRYFAFKKQKECLIDKIEMP